MNEWQEYEQRKQRLFLECESPKDYEQKVYELIQELNL